MKIRSFYQKHCGHALMMIMDMVGYGGKELWTWWWRWVTNKCLPGRWQTCRRGPRELRSTGGRGRTRSPWSWWPWWWGWRGCRDAVSREILTLFCWFQGWAGMTFEDSETGRELKKPIPEIREREGNGKNPFPKLAGSKTTSPLWMVAPQI